jgi:hypothetical protein
VSLHVVGSGGISGENLETSILHTTSGGGIIIRKQHQAATAATFLPPLTIPLIYTTSEPPSTHRSIASPFTIPELPILHQFHDVDTILKASPVKNTKPDETRISHQHEHFQGNIMVNSKWMRNSSSHGNNVPGNPDLHTGSVSSGNQQQIEVLNDTTSTVKPQYSSHWESFPARHHYQSAWADTGNKARPGNSKIPFKYTDIPSVVTPVESSLPKVPVNNSVNVQFATFNPLGNSMSNTPFSIVTLIPVRSNSGVGRPLRPRPKLPSDISIHIKNKTELKDVTLNSEYALRHKAGDREQSFLSPRPLESSPVNGVQLYEVSHKRKNNLSGSTNKSEGATTNFNQSPTEVSEQEAGSTAMDHKSQSSGFKYSTQSPTFSRTTSSAPQQTTTSSQFSPATPSNMPLPLTTDTGLTSINVTQTEAAPVLLATRPVGASSINKSAADKMATMPPTEKTNLATVTRVSQIITTTSPLRKTTQPSTVVTTKETETLPLSTSTTESAPTIGTPPPLITSITPTAKTNESSLANLASNTNHNGQVNKNATHQTKNATRIVQNMVKISSVSTLKQRHSEAEVKENITAGITNTSNIKIKETNKTNTSTLPMPSAQQENLTTRTTPSYLAQKNTVTAPKNSHSTVHSSVQPAILHTTPSEFIPVIVIQDSPDETWNTNNSNKQNTNMNSSAPTLKVHPSASSVPDGTSGHSGNITRNTNATRNASKMQENSLLGTSEIRHNKNSSGNGMGQNISIIVPNLQSGNNSSKEKLESVKENIRNTTPQPNTVTPQAVILNTDIVTTTSIEISFGENASKVIGHPLKTSQLPNSAGITIIPNISSDRHNAENVTTMKQADSHHSSTMDMPTKLPSAVTELTSTHKAKETRRQPKMKLAYTYAPSLETFKLEERMMDSTGNMKIKGEMHNNLLTPKATDVTDTTTTLNIFSSERTGTSNTVIMVTKSEPQNYKYSITSDETRTVSELNSATKSSVSANYTSDQVSSVEKEFNSTRETSDSENYSSNQFSSAEEDTILPQNNASSHLTKQGSAQREELPFTSSQSNAAQDPTLQTTHEGIILTTEKMFVALYEASTPNEIPPTKDKVTNTNNEALEMFTNFTVTKVTASSSMQGKQPPDEFELSDDDVMLLLNATRKNNFMSQEAVNTLSKYANVHTAISSNNATKHSQNKIFDGDDYDKTRNETTENYASDKKTSNTATEEAKLSTKATVLDGSNNPAGIPILTKIYNKAPLQFSEKHATTEAGFPDLSNATGA